jgi:nitrite reductase/ring-hydroxylating ferredoxin subunit
MAWTTLCALSELVEGKGKYVEVDGHQLAVFLHEGRAHVIDNYCPHAGGNIAGGWVEDGCAVCPWHNWPFRLDTGELKTSAAVRVGVYKTRLIEHQGTAMLQADLPAP